MRMMFEFFGTIVVVVAVVVEGRCMIVVVGCCMIVVVVHCMIVVVFGYCMIVGVC